MTVLTVKSLTREDVFGDMARVHQSHRPGTKAGDVIVIWACGRHVQALARGAPANNRTSIYLDMATRDRLGIKLSQEVDFTIGKADFLDEILWAWTATDAMPRIAARLGVLSIVLGIVGLILGIISLKN